MNRVTPLFLFSLPRAGSTLLQRILGAHPAVSTSSEPWILLPLFSARSPAGLFADYYHSEYVKALGDFYEALPNKEADYLAAVRDFALTLYSKAASPSATYFLDKTPRYHLIVSEILDAFPKSKIIFLWRNPLAIVSSMIETWADGRWNLYRYRVDLYTGLKNLTTAYRDTQGSVCSIRYEDLVSTPESSLERLFTYLDLAFDPSLLQSFSSVTLPGRMGDPTGIHQYDDLVQEPLEKWKATLNNPLRKAWARRYLAWIGTDRLALMGYDLDALRRELDRGSSTGHFLASDVLRMGTGLVQPWIEPEILRAKRAATAARTPIVAHG